MTQTRELILHIGHYKTGTTALQVFLNANHAMLARQGLVYARKPLRLAKHSELALVVLRDAGVQSLLHGFDAPRSAPVVWNRLFAAVRGLDDGQRMLVSSEEFIRFGAHPAAMDLLRSILHGAPDIRLRVIAYLRPPGEHLRSWYNQLVKLGLETAAFNAAVAQMEPVHWDYAAALRPWVDLVGADQVILRGFDDRLRQGEALYSDFLEAMGMRLPLLAEPPFADPNPRLDDRLLPLRRGLAREGVTREQAAHWMTRAAATLAEDATVADFAALRQVAVAGIESLAGLAGAGFDADRLLASLPQPQDPAQAAAESLIALLSGEVARLHKQGAALEARLSAIETRLGGA